MPLQYCSPFCCANVIHLSFAGRWSIARLFDQFTVPGNSWAVNGFCCVQGRSQRSLRRRNRRCSKQPYALAYQPHENGKWHVYPVSSKGIAILCARYRLLTGVLQQLVIHRDRGDFGLVLICSLPLQWRDRRSL